MEVKITGEIMARIFYNQENSYQIFAVIDNKGNRNTLCGYLPKLADDLTYEFTCEEVYHPKYGKQYKVLAYSLVKDNSREGIISYLSSNLFPHIGLIKAELIYDTLGDDCLNLIMKDPSCLDQVEKLNKNEKEILYTKILENQVLEHTFVELYQIGLTTKMVMTMFDKYHENTLMIIKENPYRLIYDLEGFGFKKADSLALKLGFKLDNIERLKALLVFSMFNLSNQYGLTYLTREQLLNSAYKFGLENSNVSLEILDNALSKCLGEGRLIIENDRLYLPHLYQSEIKIARKVNDLLEQPKPKYNLDLLETYLKDFENFKSIEFASLQQEAIKNALVNNISIITGGPGTGKTTIIHAIVEIYAALHGYKPNDDRAIGEILLCAPTGKAAKRMTEQTGFAASTIHKALGYNFENEFQYNQENLLPYKLIVVDEASMIDSLLMAHLMDAVSVRTKLVIVGDVFQLPSIGSGAVLKDLIEADLIKTTYLETIYRQGAGSSIINLATMVKEGILDESIFNVSDELKYYNCHDEGFFENLKAIIKEEMNNGYSLLNDIEVLAPMYKGLYGIDNLNRFISDNFNLNYSYEVKNKEKIFHEFDKVIELTNSSELKIMNGDLGVLEEKALMSFDDGDKEVFNVNFDFTKVKFQKKDFDNLNLAYAISIHKSQGSEFKVVILPLFKSYSIMLKRKLIYTAITRAKDKLYILGDLSSLKLGLTRIEANRQTSLAIRLNNKPNRIYINDPEIPFDYLGEENMEGITPYSFM